MEQDIDAVLNDTKELPQNIACLNADSQGLCIGSRGDVSAHSSGVLVAILEQAAQLEPNLKPPVVSVESKDKVCLIHKEDRVAGVIIKQIQK